MGSVPGKLKRFGLDYEQVKDINPKLVYCSITGEYSISVQGCPLLIDQATDQRVLMPMHPVTMW